MNVEEYDQYAKTDLGLNSAISSRGNLQVIKGLLFFSLNSKMNPILEVGPGIGTITKTLLENCNDEIYCYELDDFCIRELLKLKESNYLGAKKRLHLSSNICDFTGINFSAIIIDGPIDKNDLIKIVQKSSELKFVAVENYRLLQRVWLAKALYKGKFRQQFVEIMHDNRLTTSVFITNNQVNAGKLHIIFDYTLTFTRILPKLILHTYLSKGRILLMDKLPKPQVNK